MKKSGASDGVIKLASITYIKEARQRPSDMQRVMNYCMQEKKTWNEADGQRWITGIHCDGRNSITEFEATRAAWHKEGGILFYQYVQSFSPKENITHRQAHERGLEFAAKAWPGHEVLVTTHCDAAHIHSHFVINAVSFETGLKLRQHPTTLVDLRKLSDELCKAHGYSALQPYDKGGTKLSAREYRAAVGGDSWKFRLMYHIGEAMKRSPDKESFFREMKTRGYGVTWTKDRKYITYTCPNGKKCRDIKLHEEKYTKEMMEYEFTIRNRQAQQFVAVATGAAQCSGFGNQAADPIPAAGLCHSGGMATDGRTTVGGRGAVPAQTVSADRGVSNPGRMAEHDGSAENTDSAAIRQYGKSDQVPDATGWESEREILFGLIKDALRQPALGEGRVGENLPQMGADLGGDLGGILGAGLHTLSAAGRLSDPDEDEEERRKRMEGQQAGAALGTALGAAISALLLMRQQEQQREQTQMNEEIQDEQENIWQLSM